MINVTIWNEFVHEVRDEEVKAVYPDGIHKQLERALMPEGFNIRTCTLDQDDHGLTREVLDSTDVMLWWGHMAHELVDDSIAEAVAQRVREGMGLIVLHSGHFSKPFKKLMGTGCDLKWREAGEQEILWAVNPSHPIAEGIGENIVLEHEEMYGEFFDIPTPDEIIFISNFSGGEVFRSGCTFNRGSGKIFYFRPGHETYPTYYNKDIIRVIANSARWAYPTTAAKPVYGNAQPVRPLNALELV